MSKLAIALAFTFKAKTENGQPLAEGKVGKSMFAYKTVGWSDEEKQALIASKAEDGVEVTPNEEGDLIITTSRAVVGKTPYMVRTNTGRFMIDRSEAERLASLIQQCGAEVGVALFNQGL